MTTLPITPGEPGAPKLGRVLVVGRTESVLSESVELLRCKGYAAGASNEFDRVLEVVDVGEVDLVVFGGMVPPDTKERLRLEISARNPAVVFVQGFAGIPGLIAEQVDVAVGDGGDSGATVRYDATARSVVTELDRPHDVKVVAWWATSMVPPEPKSTSMTIMDAELPAGRHILALPPSVPTVASFVTVRAGHAVFAFIVGPMPSGTTMAQFQDAPRP